MNVEATIEEVELENDDGHEVDSVCATCTRCQHQTESFGTGPASIKRCLVLLRDECPNDETNFYPEA